MLGVGLIGTGFMGKCHALAWNSVRAVFGDGPDISLVHLGEANENLAVERASEFGFRRASGDWREVIDDPQVDVVSITTPNQFHPEMAIAALKARRTCAGARSRWHLALQRQKQWLLLQLSPER